MKANYRFIHPLDRGTGAGIGKKDRITIDDAKQALLIKLNDKSKNLGSNVQNDITQDLYE